MGAARAPAMRCNIKPRRGRPGIGYALLVCEACAVASVTIDHGIRPRLGLSAIHQQARSSCRSQCATKRCRLPDRRFCRCWIR
ncbi:hypothetical protein Xcom_12055 [Xanthomonas axonopodis pv. commiphoreae]|nr:hypothetical protein Xcom_12055 [Xanthomonas axonopodis pv. commiphoreae]